MREYKVWVFNHNSQKIELFNVFNHFAFNKQVEKLLMKCKNIEEFSNALKSEVKYYFWSKAEWEVILEPWCGCRDVEKSKVKIDVYDQLIANWDWFIMNIWEQKEGK